MNRKHLNSVAVIVAACIGATVVPAIAAETSALSNKVEEITVTARKREETTLAVPVILTAVSSAQMERRAISKLDDLTRMVPQLMLAANGGTTQGGQISIRGVAGSEQNPFADQAVSFNLDGVPIAIATVRRMAELDLATIEVLKGPQALFYGKNSPGGIISIHSADPTSTFQAKASLGYETEAEEIRGDGYVSGPITDSLGARVAVYGSTMHGWWKNIATGINYTAPKNSPKTEEYGIRGTLKYDPSDRFKAKLKVTYNKIDDIGLTTSQELSSCPLGRPQLGNTSPDDCKLDNQGVRLAPGPLLGTLSERFAADGQPYLHVHQTLISYEMNYNLTDQLQLTSVTGYFNLAQSAADNFNASFNPATLLSSANVFGNKSVSEEVRLASSFSGWLNFVGGAHYQSTDAYAGSTTFIGVAKSLAGVNPTEVNNYLLKQSGDAWSIFGQAIIKPIDKVEITGGGRYSHESKALTDIEAASAGPGPQARAVLAPNPLFPRNKSWHDFSPEATISYRPSGDLTLFASYKQGFLSGGFNSGATNYNSDLSYNQQKIKGFEGGIKARLFDETFRTDLTAYHYVITGLQVIT